MIPVKLTLSNFTSYGATTPPLDFSGFKMAAVSGSNGAGKSSLLDAITWCVWGVSRAGDSSDGLVRLGANEMSVEFSFELDGHTFTIKRSRNKKGGGSTALELWSNTHNLTEGTIKSTQNKIIEALHLTFETFTNSSFLRQGHADEFTTKGPTDRKRILADILGLDHYDKLEEKARDKMREAQTKLSLLEYNLIEIESELSQKEAREENYSKLQQEVETARSNHKEVEILCKTIEEEKNAIQVTVNTLLEQKQRFETIENEVSDIKLQISLKETAQKEYQVILDKKDLILTNYQKLQSLKVKKQGLEEIRSTLIKVKDELVDIEKIIYERENKRKEAISALEVSLREFETKNETLEAQMERLKNQKSLCPTCNQPIGTEKNLELITKNNKEVAENNKQITEIKQKLEKFKSVVLPEIAQAKIKEDETRQLEGQTKDYPEIENQINELSRFEQGYMKLQQAEVAIKTHLESLRDLQKIFETRIQELAKAKTFKEDLATYKIKLSEVSMKLLAQATVKEELSQKLLELTGQAGAQKQLIDRTTQMEKLLKEKQSEKEKFTQDKQVYEELSLAFGKKGIQAMIIEAAIPEIEDEANKLLSRLTEGRMSVKFETQKETKTKVQTNEGKVHATVETLDIVISDEMGERAYELYSGGETFRVNFAIRLAISKLLAHRAGTRLQFLVIDEGFGTQDAPGRARLVEVLDTIKDDFEKILIITHIEELKEEFPTRIEVVKGAAGSTFEIVGG